MDPVLSFVIPAETPELAFLTLNENLVQTQMLNCNLQVPVNAKADIILMIMSTYLVVHVMPCVELE